MANRSNRRTFLRDAAMSGSGLALARRAALGKNASEGKPVFRAGAAAVDATPQKLPVINSGGFLERTAAQVHDRLFARAIVLDDGSTRIAIAVVDNLMMPREMLDRVKEAASRKTSIPANRMLISATHTHSGPSVMGALGSDADEAYAEYLPGRIVEAIEQAAANLAEARVGWAAIDDSEDTNCRVWFRRPDRLDVDPFGEKTIRAMMHPGYQNPDFTSPCGPEDPGLTVLAVESPEGRPIALLANYSMHYFGAPAVSADYFGLFVNKVEQAIAQESAGRPFVAILSQGTSGDQHWMDYSRPKAPIDIDAYSHRVAQAALAAYRRIEYRAWAPLAMAETRLELRRRLPSPERAAWAEKVIASMASRAKPQTRTEVYALEQTYLRKEPVRELKLQAIRIGDLGITAIPCEVYAITGLKLKSQSPLATTMNIELANGADGYIPPHELFPFGGYNTWPARSAGLEKQAEPRIVEAVLQLLEEVAGKPRRAIRSVDSPYWRAVLESKPVAYWPMREMAGPRAADAGGRGNHGRFEEGVAFYLEGPDSAGMTGAGQASRSAYFAGGRLVSPAMGLDDDYTVEMWFWNGMPCDAREVAGCLSSRGADWLAIGGTRPDGRLCARLFFSTTDAPDSQLFGGTVIPVKTWNHVALVRRGDEVTTYLNGAMEFRGKALRGQTSAAQMFIAARSDGQFPFEGRIAEVAVYPRAMEAQEVARHVAAAGVST